MQNDDGMADLVAETVVRPKPLSPEGIAKQNKHAVLFRQAVGEIDPEQAQQEIEALTGSRKDT